jgi:hypothetical protein
LIENLRKNRPALDPEIAPNYIKGRGEVIGCSQQYLFVKICDVAFLAGGRWYEVFLRLGLATVGIGRSTPSHEKLEC